MIEIRKFRNKDAEALSKIIIENMYEINIKDHGKEVIDRLSKYFSKEKIEQNFPKRDRSLVAIKDGEIVGTASIKKYKNSNELEKKYIILTVFVKITEQHKGIGTKLINTIEQIAKEIGAKELVIPASVYACEFYRKFGFDYENGIKEQNEDKEYILVKKY